MRKPAPYGRRAWSRQDIKNLKIMLGRLPVRDIAQVMKRTESAINNRACGLQISPRTGKRL